MSELMQRLQADYKEALRARDERKVTTLRLLFARAKKFVDDNTHAVADYASFKQVMQALESARLQAAARAIGVAQSALDQAAARRMQSGVLASGRLEGSGTFTGAYMHRPNEFADELASAGFQEVKLLGVEGPGWMLFETSGREGSPGTPVGDDVLLEAAIECARATESDPSLLGASAHLLGVARVPA